MNSSATRASQDCSANVARTCLDCYRGANTTQTLGFNLGKQTLHLTAEGSETCLLSRGMTDTPALFKDQICKFYLERKWQTPLQGAGNNTSALQAYTHLRLRGSRKV